MHRLLVAYPKPADPAAFMDYYIGKHLPLARKLPGLVACRHLLPRAVGPGEPAHYLLFEADFESEAAMMEALGSEVGAKLAADVPNYSLAGASLMHYESQAD
jgi:uncharacterized protein (TIGR02118 family)